MRARVVGALGWLVGWLVVDGLMSERSGGRLRQLLLLLLLLAAFPAWRLGVVGGGESLSAPVQYSTVRMLCMVDVSTVWLYLIVVDSRSPYCAVPI